MKKKNKWKKYEAKFRLHDPFECFLLVHLAYYWFKHTFKDKIRSEKLRNNMANV